MIVDLIDRLYAGVEKSVLDFKNILLPFGLFAPNFLVLIFCLKPIRTALFYSIILAQVCVLQGLLLAVLNIHDPVIWSDWTVNFIMAMRLGSVSCMVVYVLTDIKYFAEAYFGLLVLATIYFFWKVYGWLKKYLMSIIHVISSRQLELYSLSEEEVANLYNAVLMVALECSYLGFFSVPVDRVTSYNFMCYVEVIAICLVTLFPGQLARRRTVLANVRFFVVRLFLCLSVG